MKQLLLFLCFALSGAAAAGQTFFIETRQLPLSNYVRQERQLHSAALPDQQVTFLGAEYTFGPVRRFARTNTAIRPRPLVQYVYSLPDSVVQIIQLEVDSLNYLGYLAKDRAGYREPKARHQDFTVAYQLAQRELVALLGKPNASEPEHKVTSDTGDYYTQSANWDTPDLSAQLYSMFSLVARGNGASAYRVRAEIRYKNKSAPTTRSPNNPVANAKQTAVAERFLALLLAGNYADSWLLLGPEVTQATTLAQYQATLAPFIAKLSGAERGVSLFMSGPAVGAGGQTYAVYAYKLNADSASPPQTLFNIVFKDFETELISGVQPRNRMLLTPSAK